MEALTAVQVGLLTIYDMCKGGDRGMVNRGRAPAEKHGARAATGGGERQKGLARRYASRAEARDLGDGVTEILRLRLS